MPRDEPIATPAGVFAASRCGDGPPELIFLHAGVADRRSWHAVMALSEPPVLAYDRRGFGGTPAANAPYAQVEDLLAVLDAVGAARPMLIGNSQGGRIAIDLALAHPDRVGALVLIAPAVSGEPDPDWEDELGRELYDAFAVAEAAEDLAAMNRLEVRLWLDGVAGPAGRVGGAVRELALDMNAVALAGDGGTAATDPPPALGRLEEIRVPVRVVVGALDLPSARARAAHVAAAVARGSLVTLPDRGHLPQLEDPAAIASVLA